MRNVVDEIKVEIVLPTKIVWSAPSNGKIHGEIAFEDQKKKMVEPYIIPRIGEKIYIDNQWKSIVDIRYAYNNHKMNYISIILSPEVIYVDFYKYMKTFTHAYDSFKMDNDITKKDSNYYIQCLPETLNEWMEDIEILKQNHTDEERLILVEKRCKHVEDRMKEIDTLLFDENNELSNDEKDALQTEKQSLQYYFK